MNIDPTRIVITETRCRHCGILLAQVYHRDFAVMRVDGRSAEEAAGYLVNRLGAAVNPSLREAVRAALTDARAFLDGCAVWSQPPR